MRCKLCSRSAMDLCSRCAKRWMFNPEFGIYCLRPRAKAKFRSQRRLAEFCKEISPEVVLQEVAFPGLKSDKDKLLRFDIAVPGLKILIEYHGCDGFVPFVHHRKSAWLRTKQHDKMKRKFAKDIGWKLIHCSRKDLTPARLETKLKCLRRIRRHRSANPYVETR